MNASDEETLLPTDLTFMVDPTSLTGGQFIVDGITAATSFTLAQVQAGLVRFAQVGETAPGYVLTVTDTGLDGISGGGDDATSAPSDVIIDNFTTPDDPDDTPNDPPLPSTGTGLRAEYYNNVDFTDLVLTRTDATVNFDWGRRSPDPQIGQNSFSVRWTGQVQAIYSETYTFYTKADDGVRLWVNDQLLTNSFTEGLDGRPRTEYSGKIDLVAGQKYDIHMEYYDSKSSASARLYWSSPSQSKEIVPQSQLYLSQDVTMIPPMIFPADAEVSNVMSYGAIPNDGVDDTAAIQSALSETASGNKIIYLPAGTYLVSDRLDWPAGNDASDAHKRTILQGEDRDRTIIKLQDSAPGYQDPDNPQSVIWTGTTPAQRFRNSLRDLTINTGTDNPGAIGLQFIASNQGTIRDVSIISEDGQGQVGLDLKYTRDIGPAYIKDLSVEGFDYGIQTYWQVNSLTFEDIRLENQNVLGWENFAQSVFIRGLESVNSVTALKNVKESPGSVTLIDANLTGTGDTVNTPAILNQTAGMFLRNIQTSGYGMAVKHDNKGRGNEPGVTNANVDEWLARGDTPDALFDSPNVSLNLPIQNTPVVPWDEVSDWVSPLDFGGQPNDGIDDRAAIQAAIDSGATTVYLPNGRWHLEGSLKIRENVRRFLGTEASLIGNEAEIEVLNTTQPVVQIERIDMLRGDIDIVHASEQTLVLSSLTMNGQYRSPSDLTNVGDLYIEDVVGGPFYFSNQSVWARQINPETNTQKTDDRAKIVNDGATLWILGLKAEEPGTVVKTINGGRTEVLGGLVYSTGDPKTEPAFINNESALSLAGVVERNFNGNTFDTWVQETRNGETRSLLRNQISAPLYVGDNALAASDYMGILPVATGQSAATQNLAKAP